MPQSAALRSAARPGAATYLLFVMIGWVTLTGGASLPEALGQPLVRVGSLLLVATAVAINMRLNVSQYRMLGGLLLAALILVAVQLIPLPPTIWRALPARGGYDVSLLLPQLAGTWRPAALVPDAAWNALYSLVVPISTFLLLSALPPQQLRFVPPALIVMAAASSVVAALQFAGAGLDNPLINDRTGYASGLLANRNHQALLLSIGVVTAMQWGATRPFAEWRIALAFGATAWFVLMILATGSRAGLLLGVLALGAGAGLVMSVLRRSGLRLSSRAWLAGGATAVLVLGGIVLVSLYAGRSESIERLNEASVSEDLRVRALPYVLEMVRGYFPIGAGQGSFGTLFRVVEPDVLLKPTYFNHAHNDYLELLIEAGVAGALLLGVALGWLALLCWRALRRPGDGEAQRARLGAIIILLVLVASIVDYPARTPLIMMTVILAAGLLSGQNRAGPLPLPGESASLYNAQNA